MGNIVKILNTTKIPDQPTLQTTRMTVEKCENLHIHYRNQRMEFSEDEFNFYVDKLIEAREALKDAPEETDFHSLYAGLELNEDPDYFPDRLQVEANVGAVHIHYKNIRLELTKDEFLMYGRAMYNSILELASMRPEIKHLSLEDINPNDGGHQLNEDGSFTCHNQKEHEEQIAKIKREILNKKHIRPIVVSPDGYPYQRMDGFCRYVAHKQLGEKTIETIICPLAYPGCQDKKSVVISPKEYKAILDGETY